MLKWLLLFNRLSECDVRHTEDVLFAVAGLRRSDHITDDTLASFHWLRAPERIKFKLAVIVYRGIHGTAPRYLSDLLHRVSDITSRRRLRSSTSSELSYLCRGL